MKMFDSLGAEKDKNKPIKGMLVCTTNPAQSLPNANKYFKGMKDAYLVVLEIFPTRTTQFADVILPAAFIYEKGGVYGCSERRSQLTGKCVEPPGEAKAGPLDRGADRQANGIRKTHSLEHERPGAGLRHGLGRLPGMREDDTEHTLYGITRERLQNSTEDSSGPAPTRRARERRGGTFGARTRSWTCPTS